MKHCELLMRHRVNVARFIAMGAMCSLALGYVIYEARTGGANNDSKNHYSKASSREMNVRMSSVSKLFSPSNILMNFGEEDDDSDAIDAVSLMGASGAYSYSRIGPAYE